MESYLHSTAKQLNEEKAASERRKKEREEQHLYQTVAVVTEANYKAHQGFDLTSWDTEVESPSTPKTQRVMKTSTIEEFQKSTAESLDISPENVRLWVMVNRQNKTTRPDQPILEPDMTIEAAFTKYGGRDRAFRLWVEQASTFEDGVPIWPEIQPANANSSNSTILIFLKYFDAEEQTLRGVGHVYVKKQQKVADIVPLIHQLMGWNNAHSNLSNGVTNGVTTPPTLALHEEIKHSMIEPMKPKLTLQQAELQDGDIVCFQKVLSEKQNATVAQAGGYTTAQDFYDHLLNRKTIHFYPRGEGSTSIQDFKLELSRKMSYEQYSAKVGEYLKIDPTHLRFFTVTNAGKPKTPVRRSANQNLSQTMNPQFGQYGNNNQRDDALYFEILEMSLSEFDTKKTMKLAWITEGVSKEVRISSFPPLLMC